MNTREIASEYRLTHWARIMQARQGSGLSIKAFCIESGFPENVYYYWQRKLREAACTELAAGEPVKALVPNGWARLDAAPPQAAITVEINGCCVQVRADTNPELLAQVCRMLKSI